MRYEITITEINGKLTRKLYAADPNVPDKDFVLKLEDRQITAFLLTTVIDMNRDIKTYVIYEREKKQ